MARRTTALSIAAVMLLSACNASGDHSPKPLAGWPTEFDAFTIVWSAEPAVDLRTGPAVVVRAYAESYQLADLTGNADYLYPGFAQAVGERQSGNDNQHLWPNTDSPAKTPWVGTERNHILSITRADRDITAVVCMYTYAAGIREMPDAKDRYIAQDGGKHSAADAGIAPMRITLTAPADPGSTLAPQAGPARTPAVDVFGGYRVTSYLGGYFRPGGSVSDWPDRQQTVDTCVSKAPDPFERRQYFTTNFHHRADFPVATPFPGWPAPPHETKSG